MLTAIEHSELYISLYIALGRCEHFIKISEYVFFADGVMPPG